MQNLFTAAGDKVMASPSVLYSEECAIVAVDGGESGYLHVRLDGVMHDGLRDVHCVEWKVFSSDMDLIGKGDDIFVPLHRVDTTLTPGLDAMRSLLSFLTACAESKSEESENYSLFDRAVREWAECYSDELGMIALEIEETES